MLHTKCTWGRLGCDAQGILSGKTTEQPKEYRSPVGPEPIGFKIEYCAPTPEVSHFGFNGSPKLGLTLRKLSLTMYPAQNSQSSYRGKHRAGTC